MTWWRYVCVFIRGLRERERERERESETDGQTDRDRQAGRQTDRQTETHRERENIQKLHRDCANESTLLRSTGKLFLFFIY